MLDQSHYASLMKNRVALERELGRRSFYDFYRMAWPMIDSAPYADGNHIRLICQDLQRAGAREIRQLVFCVPPRHSKSLLCSVAFPAWVWTWWPAAKFISSAYDQALATRDSLHTRRLVESRWYADRWPEVRLERDQNQKTFYETTAGGARFISSPTSRLTGQGADFTMFDDPHNVVQGESEADRLRALRFWFEAMPSRLNQTLQGVSIVIQQRVHEKDVAGECMRRGWHSVVLPARFEPDHPNLCDRDWRSLPGEPLWPARFSHEALDVLESAMGPYAAAGQLQQRPAPRTGGFFDRAHFEVIDQIPAGSWTVLRAWDLAGTKKSVTSPDPDWSVGIKLVQVRRQDGSLIYVVTDMVRFREDPGQTEINLRNVATSDGKSCRIFLPQDPAQAGKAQIQRLVGAVLNEYPVQFETVSGDKVLRATPAAALAKAGFIKLLSRGWDVEAFLTELASFPTGSHDDIVDALASAISRFHTGTSGMLDWMRMQANAQAQSHTGAVSSHDVSNQGRLPNAAVQQPVAPLNARTQPIDPANITSQTPPAPVAPPSSQQAETAPAGLTILGGHGANTR